MKRTVSKICLAVLWALSLIVMVALIFFSVPYLNDAITCGGVNSIGQFSSKIVELVDGWKLPGLSSQEWIDIFMALIVVILLGISIWPAIVAYKKPKAVINNDGEVTTKAASVEKNEKKHGFGHFVLAFFAIVVWLLTLIVICGMIAVFVPSIRLSMYDSRTVLYWRKLAVEALSGLSGIPVLGYFALFVVIILVVLIALSVLLGVLAFKKPKEEDEDELLAQEQATLLEGAPVTVEQVNAEQKVEQKQPIEKVVKNDILHKDERIKRGVFKGLAIFLWIVEGFTLIALIAIAIPPVRHFLTDHITSIGYWAYMIVNNIGLVWFYVGYVLIMVVLALLSAWFASIGYKKAKVETAPDKELEVGKNDSVVPFVDSNGNFGHVVVKDDSVSPLKKYSDGTLTENQLDMEFDWHNYVHHKPVVRIVLAVVLFFVGAFLVLLRVISYGRFAMFKSLASFVDPVNEVLDRYVLNGLFGAYKNIEIFSIGSHAFTAAQFLDGFFTVLMVYILAFLVLLFATFIAWCFRKPGAVKRANKAREKYLNSIIGHDFDNEFLPSASLNVGASQPKDNATGEAMEIDLDKLGTGVKGFKSIEGNYEGNIVNDSTTSISLNSFESDVLILGKPLFESIADVKVQTQVPAYENIEEFADGQGNVTPVDEIRPSDREPSYWYDKNEPVASEPVVEEVKSDRPSDKTPDYWYGRNEVKVVEEVKSDRPSDKTPDYWYGRNEVKVVEEAKSDSASDKTPDYWYDQNEPEPEIEVIKEIRPSDREPNYWYDKNEEVEQEPVVKELRPSDREPWYWYGDPEPVIEKQPEEVKVEEPVYEFKGERASNFEPEHWYHLAKIDSERRASDEEPEYWYGDSEPVIEKQPEEVKVEEPVYEFKGERASNFEPEHWYHLAKIDSERRASDEEPEYWYKRNEVKKHPNVKRMGAPIPEPIEDAGFDVEPLSPVQPIKKDEPTPLPEEGEVKPVVVAPVKLDKSDISEVASMDNIKPVEARVVRFQLKKIKGNYKGDLTPEEAFNKAVTNQATIVTPMLQGQGLNKGSKYLANRASKERADVRRTGYVSAVSVNPEENHDTTKKFDKPVSEFKSIREWAQAKKKFEEEQKLLANSGNEDVVEPVKPIVVVEQAPKPVESKSEASIKKPSPVKASIVEPLDLDDLGDLDPVTPLDPIKNKSKGE